MAPPTVRASTRAAPAIAAAICTVENLGSTEMWRVPSSAVTAGSGPSFASQEAVCSPFFPNVSPSSPSATISPPGPVRATPRPPCRVPGSGPCRRPGSPRPERPRTERSRGEPPERRYRRFPLRATPRCPRCGCVATRAFLGSSAQQAQRRRRYCCSRWAGFGREAPLSGVRSSITLSDSVSESRFAVSSSAAISETRLEETVDD